MKKLTAITSCLAIALFLCSAASSSAVTRLGNPFRPAGANFDITGIQGIDASTPLGTSNGAQVNKDFEFTPSIGVTYTNNGKLTDFGLGLYQDNSGTHSTGLRINYDTLVKASSITITVEDFDIDTKATFFNPNKVMPVITLFGPNNSVFATIGPKDIFPNLKPNTTAGTAKGDVWDISFAGLLNTLHLSDTDITGFLLSADMTNGEKANSDPYLLLSVGNGIPVPEASNYMAGIAALVFAGLFHMRQLKLRKSAASV